MKLINYLFRHTKRPPILPRGEFVRAAGGREPTPYEYYVMGKRLARTPEHARAMLGRHGDNLGETLRRNRAPKRSGPPVFRRARRLLGVLFPLPF